MTPWLLAVSVVLATAEVAFRRSTDPFSRPMWWHDPVNEVKERQMWALPPGSGEITIIGSSTALCAVAPEVVAASAKSGSSVYNAAFQRAVPRVAQRWLNEVVLPSVNPRTVLWLISFADLNEGASFNRAVEADYLKTARSRLVPRQARFVLGRSALLRHRHLLGRPRALARTLARPTPVARVAGAGRLSALGQWLDYANFSYAKKPGMERLIKEEIIPGYGVGGKEFDVLSAATHELRCSGVRVVWVWVPVTRNLEALLPVGLADQIRAALADLGDRTGVEVWTPGSDLAADLENFADMIHMNGTGATRYSQALGDALGRLDAPRPRDQESAGGPSDGRASGERSAIRPPPPHLRPPDPPSP